MSSVPRLKVPKMKPPHGRTPPRPLCSGDSIGFGAEFASASIIFAYNGARLLERVQQSLTFFEESTTDMYAAVKAEGDSKFDFGWGALERP
jgi:hypothetical protein